MKVREVFDIAVALLGETAQEEGICYDLEGFSRNAAGIVNVLSGGLDELDCILKQITPDSDNRLPAAVKELEDEIGLHPLICRAVLPFGLCYLLLLEENPSRATHFLKLYESEKSALKRRFNRTRRHRIRNVYGDL